MAAPGAPLLPRTGSMLLYTLTAANARVAMAESTFGRGLSAGDVQPLLVTHVDTFGEVVHLVGVVITSRGVNLPVDGVPLVREPTPGAAHWPGPDESLVATLEERAEPRNDAPLKQASGRPAEQTGMSAPLSRPGPLGLLRQVRDVLVSYLEPGGVSAPVAMGQLLGIVDNAGTAALINGPDGISPDEAQLRDDLVTERNNAQHYKLRAEALRAELERTRAHETHLIKDRDRLIHGDCARLHEQVRSLTKERDEAQAMHARAEAALREAVDERDGYRALCRTLGAQTSSMAPAIQAASVKVMRSHDYCHFEVCLSSSGASTLEGVDALRKEAARLADKAVEQYKAAKAAAALLDKMRSKHELRWAEQTPESERTPTQKAIIKFHQDADFAARFHYDYEDDYEGPTPGDLDEE